MIVAALLYSMRSSGLSGNLRADRRQAPTSSGGHRMAITPSSTVSGSGELAAVVTGFTQAGGDIRDGCFS